MTSVTRQELEACCRLLGTKPLDWMTDASLEFIASENLLELARAAKLCVDYRAQFASRTDGSLGRTLWNWPTDGTEAECIIKAAAAVQLEREKSND